MTNIELTQLIAAGVHFGHKASDWNPKMLPYIYEEKNGFHILDLIQTTKLLKKACEFVNFSARQNKIFLFVGTKRQASALIEEEAKHCNSYYVNYRWLAGTLTNWSTIKAQIEQLKKLEQRNENNLINTLPKKVASIIRKELKKLQKSFSGLKNIPRKPDILIIIDQKIEFTAIKEAKRLNIPIISIVDTDCNPNLIDFPIPGNDDGTSSIKLILKLLSENIVNGMP